MTKPMAEIGLNFPSGKQLKLPLVPDSDLVSGTNTIPDKNTLKKQAIQRYLDRAEKDPVPFIEEYSPGKRNTKYYRLVYRGRKKLVKIHIKGGSIISELARYRAKKLQAMIDRGAELEEIIAATKTYNL